MIGEQQSESESRAYVLLTAAYNEEAYIEKTIQSVLAQTLLPSRWVIVSDNSTDETDHIVSRYAAKYDFIKFLRVSKKAGHNFGAKVIALQRGAELLGGADYKFIGNLDADLAVENSYFKNLVSYFLTHPGLGICSGFVYEDHGQGFCSRPFNDARNVPHAAQLMRRECYEAIQGYSVLKYGGEDWYAQICARMHGWQVESIPQLKIFHFRHTGGKSVPLRNSFRLGKMDYSFGSNPVFASMKSLRRIKERPYMVSALARLAGFFSCYVSREKREVPKEFVVFLRNEQTSRMFSWLRHKNSFS